MHRVITPMFSAPPFLVRKDPRAEFSRLYHKGLQQFLKHNGSVDIKPMREIGQRAILLGLETLDLARIHEIALTSLVLTTFTPDFKTPYLVHSTPLNKVQMGRAGLFFAEVIQPIEQSHRGAREENTQLTKIVKILAERTLELSESVAELKQEVFQRRAVEAALRTSEQTTSDLLVTSRQLQEELRELSRQLLSVQEDERRKISIELHDVVSQTLTGIHVRLAALKSESTIDQSLLHRKIASTQRLVGKSLDIVHRFATELRPTALDDLGLIPALKSFLKRFMAETGVRVSLKVCANIEQSSSEIRTVLFRVTQESLTNVSRHANASSVQVLITHHDDVVCMEITDDGSGFEVEGKSCAAKPTRLGLLGMKERVEMIGGIFSVHSAPGKPTTIKVKFSIPPPF